MSLRNFRRKKSYLDLDYIYGTLSASDGEDPLDYAALAANPAECLVVACNAQTGETTYFDKAAFHQDDYSVLKASSAIPLVCHPYAVEGTAYYDGALADTIPIEKAFAMGCDVVVLLLTKPADMLRTDKKDRILARGIQRRYPMAAQRLRGRAQRYNDGVALARELERQGRRPGEHRGRGHPDQGSGGPGTAVPPGIPGRPVHPGLYSGRPFIRSKALNRLSLEIIWISLTKVSSGSCIPRWNHCSSIPNRAME